MRSLERSLARRDIKQIHFDAVSHKQALSDLTVPAYVSIPWKDLKDGPPGIVSLCGCGDIL